MPVWLGHAECQTMLIICNEGKSLELCVPIKYKNSRRVHFWTISFRKTAISCWKRSRVANSSRKTSLMVSSIISFQFFVSSSSIFGSVVTFWGILSLKFGLLANFSCFVGAWKEEQCSYKDRFFTESISSLLHAQFSSTRCWALTKGYENDEMSKLAKKMIEEEFD